MARPSSPSAWSQARSIGSAIGKCSRSSSMATAPQVIPPRPARPSAPNASEIRSSPFRCHQRSEIDRRAAISQSRTNVPAVSTRAPTANAIRVATAVLATISHTVSVRKRSAIAAASAAASSETGISGRLSLSDDGSDARIRSRGNGLEDRDTPGRERDATNGPSVRGFGQLLDAWQLASAAFVEVAATFCLA